MELMIAHTVHIPIKMERSLVATSMSAPHHRSRSEGVVNKETSLLVALAVLLVCSICALAISYVVGGLAAFLAIPFILSFAVILVSD
jgi:F0F1-type ATP synthase assembly protein I